jgi:SSS family solute:Na+ symporter
MMIVSYTSEAPDPNQIQGLTLGTVSAEQKAETKATYQTVDYVSTGFVLVLILAAYLYFTG